MALSHSRLVELYAYEKATGMFTRRQRIGRGAPGPVETTPDNNGYLRLCIDYESHLQHRLAWLYVTGSWPEQMVDHRNRVPHDNRWENLREADQSLNQLNRCEPLPGSSTGLIGAHRRKTGKFTSSVMVGGRLFYLGTFVDAHAAHAAYLLAKEVNKPGAFR